MNEDDNVLYSRGLLEPISPEPASTGCDVKDHKNT